MCQKLKKLLFVLLFALLCSVGAFAQDDSSDLEYWNQVAQELTIPIPTLITPSFDLPQNSMQEQQNVTTTSTDSETLNLESMSVWELFDKCDEKVTSLQLRVQTLSQYSQSLEEDLSRLMTDVTTLKADLTRTRNALLSNREDTDSALALAGEFYEKAKALEERVAYAERKNKNSTIYANVVTPIPGLIFMVQGFIEMGKGNTDYGWRLFEIGAITLVGMEVVYQGGHWLFKIW